MDSAELAVTIASRGIQTCEELIRLLDSWKSDAFVPDSEKTITSTLNHAYDAVADLSKDLRPVVISLRSRRGLDEETLQSLYADLPHCDTAFTGLSNTLEGLRKHYTREGAARFLTRRPKREYLRRKAQGLPVNALSVRMRLKPALHALKSTQAETDIATTSGFEKGQINRHPPSAQRNVSRPAIDLGKTRPLVEEGETTNTQNDAGSDSHLTEQETSRPDLNTPETTGATGEQLAQDPPAAKRKALLRRIPFCYLLSALAFIFISSSSAVGLYFSIAQNAMGDGFTTAGFILAVGTLTVTPPAAYHYQHCRCWRLDPDDVHLRGMA